MVDSYLENAMDYVQEAFESANQWMKENDPLRFPEVEASVWDALDNDRGNDRGNDRNEGRDSSNSGLRDAIERATANDRGKMHDAFDRIDRGFRDIIDKNSDREVGRDRNDGRDSSNSGLRDAIERATANDRGKMHDAFDRIDRGFNFLRDIIDRDERSGSHDESYKVLRNDLGLGSHAMDKNNVRYDILSDKAYVEKSWEDFNAQFKNNGENTQAGENFKQQEANIRRLEAGHHKVLDYSAHIANIKAAEKVNQEEAKVEKEAKLKKAEDEFKELKERHLKMLEDTSKSSDANAEAMGKNLQGVVDKTSVAAAKGLGAAAGGLVGGILGAAGGPLGVGTGRVLGAVVGEVIGEQLGEYSVEKAKEIVNEHEKEKEEL